MRKGRRLFRNPLFLFSIIGLTLLIISVWLIIKNEPINHTEVIYKEIYRNVVKLKISREITVKEKDQETSRIQSFTGTGVVISDDEEIYILTAYHVIKDAAQITIFPNTNHPPLRGSVKGYDHNLDIALVEINDTKLWPPISTAKLGSSERLAVGNEVWAFGSPFGLENTITTGKVVNTEALSPINPLWGRFILSDCKINPGNSGGPLLDKKGHVIGINTTLIGPKFEIEKGNEGFTLSNPLAVSVPIDAIKKILPKLKSGTIEHPFIGIDLADAWKISDKDYSYLKINRPPFPGPMITAVERESTAETIGLQVGDVIISINGKSTPNVGSVLEILFFDIISGDILNIAIYRNDQNLVKSGIIGQHSKIIPATTKKVSCLPKNLCQSST